LHRLDHRLVPDLHRDEARLGHADGGELIQRHVAAIGLDLHRIEHRGGGAAGAQAAELVLEGLDGALHAALHFVEVEITRGHHVSPSKSRRPHRAPPFRARQMSRQPATMVPWPMPRRIAPIDPGSAIENTMIGSDVSRASAKAVASITLYPPSIACEWVSRSKRLADGSFLGSAL